MERFLNLVKLLRNTIYLDFNALSNIKSEFSNWVVPGRIMCGPYPGFDGVNFKTDKEASTNIENIINDGINVMICLQEEEKHQMGSPQYGVLTKGKVTFLHFPIEDNKIPKKETFIEHMTIIMECLLNGKNIYIHFLGGHGRTGLYVACILLILYKLDAKHALYFTQSFHNSRRKVDNRCLNGIPYLSPGNDCQIEFVKQFESFLSFLI